MKHTPRLRGFVRLLSLRAEEQEQERQVADRLLNAAPDLLAACKALLGALMKPDDEIEEAVFDMAHLAEAAIAKAESGGEASQ